MRVSIILRNRKSQLHYKTTALISNICQFLEICEIDMKFYRHVIQSGSTRFKSYLRYSKKERANKKHFAYDRVNKLQAREVDKARNVRGTLAVIVTRQSRCRAVRQL